MIRIYRFSFFYWGDDNSHKVEHQLYDGLFSDAAEAKAFLAEMRENEEDLIGCRVDAIDFLDPSCMNFAEWTTNSDWWHPHPMVVPA